MRWTCQDGRKIEIKDLDNEHLLNIINYLRRNADTIRARRYYEMLAYSEDAPDGAAMHVTTELSDLMREEDKDIILKICIPEYKELLKEKKRRKL